MGYIMMALISIILLTDAVSTTVTDFRDGVAAERSITRVLRTSNVEVNEERGISPLLITKLKLWQSSNTPASEVFKSMKLTSAEGNILAKSKFRAWITYVDDLNNKTPSQAKSAASVLTENFYDNAVLSKMLNIAMKDESTQTLAIKLQGQRLENWKTGNVDPLRVLQLLKLDQRDILKNPMLVSLMKYMDDFNARNPTKKTTMIDTFSHYLMNDRRLAKLLETGQKIPATKEISLALQLEWFAKWERMKFTPNDAFKALGLKGTYEATGPLLSDPALYFWVRYLTEFNQKHPSARTSLIDTLRRNYADEAIVDMIVAAKVVPTTKHSAENLELSLLRKWVLEKKNPATIGRWLLADKSGAMYTKYEAYYNAKWAAGA